MNSSSNSKVDITSSAFEAERAKGEVNLDRDIVKGGSEVRVSIHNDENTSIDSVNLESNAEKGDATKILNEKPQLSKKNFYLAIVGLSAGYFLVSLNSTVVSTALPTIATNLHAFSMISWVATSFLLTSTVFQPIYCKLAEIFEKRIMLLIGTFIFEVGCLLCGLSTSIGMLIIARFIAGFGAAGLLSLVILSISDLVPLRERGKYVGINGALYALSSVIGPLVGGVFTDHLSWRWCFYINLPLGAIAFVIMIFVLPFRMPKGNLKEKLKRIDFFGAIIFMGGFLLFLLGLNFGGNRYPWKSAAIIGLFVGGAALLAVFVFVEMKIARDPIIPMEIFKIRNVVCTLVGQFCIGVGMLTLIYYAPVYYHLIYNGTAINQGLFLLPALIGMVILSIGSGYVISITGIYRPIFWIGSAVFAVGMGMLGTMNQNTSSGLKILYLALSGVGMGSCLQSMLVVAQASVPKNLVFITTTIVQFMRVIGGAFGIAIVATVFNTVLSKRLAETALTYPEYAELIKSVSDNSSLAWAPDVPPELHNLIISNFTKAINSVFYTTVPFLVIAFIFTLGIKHVNLGGKK